jgi:DNA polymerase-3 subunit delta
MKLTAGQITGFLQKPDPAARVVLVYGPDAGLVSECAEQLAKTIVPDLADPFRVAVLSNSTLSDDPARLADEMAAQALGGGRRLVRITSATDAIVAALNSLFEHMPPGDSFLLIEAGELEKRSKLRVLCEGGDKTAYALACYAEEGAARHRVISDILQNLGMRTARDALVFLSEVLPPDRIAMRSELEKLALYAGKQSEIKMEDVLAIVQDAGAAEIDDLIYAVGSGETRRAQILLERLFGEQTSPVAILRAAQRHFLRLQWARGEMERGASAGEAVKKLQPPVFWKYTETMSAQLRRWPSNKIERALDRLYDAEAAVKRTGTPDTALCAQLLIQMAA